MATESFPHKTSAAAAAANSHQERSSSIFDAPANFLESCRLLNPFASSFIDSNVDSANSLAKTLEKIDETEKNGSSNVLDLPRWTCHTCNSEFESLHDQRSHFKSDIHRLNIKLRIAGKAILKEEDIDELASDSLQEYDVSSISGSEDESENTGSFVRGDVRRGSVESVKKKLFVRLRTGERISIWKSLIMEESESVSYDNEKTVDNGGCLLEGEVIERLNSVIHETRDNKNLRVVLLASGGHFAGCVFDGKSVVAHKTFHRYVVRARAGKQQSLKDAAGGKNIHSAGASLRRYNELALKKEIQEMLTSWKPYFDACSSVFIHAPLSSRQLLSNGDKLHLSLQQCSVRNVPLTMRRPTMKEAQRIYNQLTQIAYEAEEVEAAPRLKDNSKSVRGKSGNSLKIKVSTETLSEDKKCEEPVVADGSQESEVIGTTTLLHEAAQSNDSHKVLELLEQGLDPCIKDKRGQTPYMLASEKEVRNTFRRFMALNLDKWDWNSAKVPSPLTKEMEESQAAKQAEKDAKKKARAKELKKLRKAKEKKAQAEAALSKNVASNGQSQPSGVPKLSKEEELKRAQAIEREKRAAAAEKRLAAASSTTITAGASDVYCSCCNSSLAGKVPFHRYNYKYCSTSCMHVHREILEDS